MTTDPIPQENESFASDIFGITQYEPETRKKKKFLPWHRPRKQYVRHSQWHALIEEMVDEIRPENNTLKYLGLPGDDLLDIRYFHKYICEPRSLNLRYLGFNENISASSSEQTDLNISLDEVSKLAYVDPSSDVIGDDICQLAKADSLAWDKSTKMGPYDVINIDLCDGFGKHPIREFEENHYNTLLRLITLQARRPHPWLLFLTTRTGSKHVNAEIFSIFKKLYGKNLTNCAGFQEASQAKFSIGTVEDLDNAVSNESSAADIFLVALCKWISSLVLTQRPPVDMTVKSVIGYKVYPEAIHQDLVSLAIKFNPTFIASADTHGISTPNDTELDECIVAINSLNNISSLENADDILRENSELMKDMIKMSSALLEEARYDVKEYTTWVAKDWISKKDN
jgi:hypothetical protein